MGRAHVINSSNEFGIILKYCYISHKGQRDKMCYGNISQNIDAERCEFEVVWLLWSSTIASATLLPRGPSNFWAIRSFYYPLLQLQIYTRYGSKTSHNRAHEPMCQLKVLTYWNREEIDTILQTTVSSAFFWMKMYAFWLRFHWSLLLMAQLITCHHWFRLWLGANQGYKLLSEPKIPLTP